MKILICDDAKLARLNVKRSLPENLTEDGDIEYALNGAEAVEKYKASKFDLVFMDLTMPEMDGYEATKLITQYDPDAYIIVVTADIQNSGVATALENGARSVIKKPIDTSKLNEVLIHFFKYTMLKNHNK